MSPDVSWAVRIGHNPASAAIWKVGLINLVSSHLRQIQVTRTPLSHERHGLRARIEKGVRFRSTSATSGWR